MPTYPCIPKSTAPLNPGQFWSVRRDDGRFGIGLVLGVPTPNTAPHHATSTRIFVAGLMDRVLERAASAEDVSSARLGSWGFAHVRTIALSGSGLGLEGLANPNLNEVSMVSHRSGGSVGLYSNGRLVREATQEEAMSLPVYGTWGLTFIQRLASALT